MIALLLRDCMSLVHMGRTSIPYLQPSSFYHFLHFGSHFYKCEALCVLVTVTELEIRSKV